MPTVPDSGSATSQLGIAKFALSVLCILGGAAAAIFVPGVGIWLGGTLITVGAQGALSGAIGIKAADAPQPKP